MRLIVTTIKIIINKLDRKYNTNYIITMIAKRNIWISNNNKNKISLKSYSLNFILLKIKTAFNNHYSTNHKSNNSIY